MTTTDAEVKKAAVRKTYGEIAAGSVTSGCCSSDCCGTPPPTSADSGYSADERSSVPMGADLGLGCGNPQAIASLQSGERVLDLGSGAGFDALLAAQRVGPGGHVIGVDMTEEMITRARANAATLALGQVEFRLGEIERLPAADASADVVMSNCVINLSPDKPAVFREAFRVLAPGGRLAIADLVSIAPLPASLREDPSAYTGCLSGAATVADLEAMLREAGFTEVRVKVRTEGRAEGYVAPALIQAVKPVRAA